MAGKSERYFKQGFTKPKFLLPVGNKTMIEKVVEMFDAKNDEFIFIISKQDAAQYGAKDFLNNLPLKRRVFEIEQNNFGPTYTALEVEKEIGSDEEVIINYCDFLLEWDYADFLKRVRAGYDGGMPSFKGFHPASLGNTYYAYLKINKKNEFLELREKQPFTDNRMQEHASTGTYYFKTWAIFCKYANLQIEKKVSAGNGEFYPSLLYNLMQQDDLKSLVYEVKKFICLGTPEDYLQYQYWYRYFTKI